MRGKTRNLLENVGAFGFLILIIYGVFNLIAHWVNDSEPDIKAPSQLEQVVEQRDIVQPEVTTQPKEIQVEKKDIVKSESEQIEEKEKSSEEKISIDKVEQKTTQEKTIEPTQEDVVEKIEQEPKEEKTETKKSFPSDELIKQKFALINRFLRSTKKQIAESVLAMGIVANETPRYANIRVTVLKDGGFEQLTLLDGDKEYFDLISDAVINVFPLEIDERIDDQFPRYFRMKLIEGQ